jgi:hypothetical protein
VNVPEPRIKRYALVRQQAGADGVRRLHLARVARDHGGRPAAERLERMEEIAALEWRAEDRAPERDNGHP